MKAPSTNPFVASAFAQMRVAPPYVANFDSASGMLRATAAYLRGEDFPGMGTTPPAFEPIADLINKLPKPIQEVVYALGSAGEAISPNQDRLTIMGMSYFRVKRLCMGEAYERFLENSLPPGLRLPFSTS
ncbi:MAG: hypothetical protein LDL41_04505 [Coleofasciculus sp. S288]|nr:hypothetical protein [Coleofasciculus sp. S288]